MTLHIHHLYGCSPAPLANYLKALGILRLVGEQVDVSARGWWQDEHFCLMSHLTTEEVEHFFLKTYQPTPIVSPWNKGSGFYKANDPGLAPLENSTASRFERYRRGVSDARMLLDSVANADGVIRSIKARTKTNKSFQTDEQRQSLANSDVFNQTISLLEQLGSRSDVPEKERDIVLKEIDVVRSLIIPATRPATKAEAGNLKENGGYKRILAAAERRFRSLKASMIPDCRKLWRGPHANWISAALVLDDEGNPAWPSLLGTGGNDGNLDFTNNVMQRLGDLFDLASTDGDCHSTTRSLLLHAIWSSPSDRMASSAIGQFQPGNAGGANSSTGSIGESLVNAWDFVLMMEGAILFSSRSTRRLDPSTSSRASAPFAIRSQAIGHNSPGFEKAQRGEQWMPIWCKPATLDDVSGLLGDARLQLGKQTANRPIDAAHAISRLGVARGIDSFVRYGYLERNGQSNLAVPLGRIRVRQSLHAYLIDDLSTWLDRVHRRSQDKNSPSRFSQRVRILADSVMSALTHDDAPGRWQEILQSAAQLESLQTTGSGIDAGPIPALSVDWINAIDDGSPEVRLATALGSAASAYSNERKAIDPVRHHWLPLERGARRFKTSDKRLAKDPRVVVTGRDPISDCAAIVERRFIEAAAKGERRLRLVSALGASARLEDLALFVCGQLDIQRVFDLARALMAVKWDEWHPKFTLQSRKTSETPPEAWLALRLACLPWPLADGRRIPSEPTIVRRLMSGDSSGAIQTALTRLRSTGIRVPLRAAFTDPQTARLWAAALVFPIDRQSATRAMAILDPSTKVQHA
ncbi:MAG: type I-U CRISPR-associated protein Csx17 [Planctomycetota bacterium]